MVSLNRYTSLCNSSINNKYNNVCNLSKFTQFATYCIDSMLVSRRLGQFQVEI